MKPRESSYNVHIEFTKLNHCNENYIIFIISEIFCAVFAKEN